MSKTVTRFPPSPTGSLHIGNVRTAIFNYLYARNVGGSFIVRVEDTDKERSRREYEEDMLASVAWLGFSHDNEVVWRQSERTEVYTRYLRQLIDSGAAYLSQEIEGANKEVVRFRNPNKVITFKDLIRGEVTIDTSDLGDFIIARNINDPVYHMAVVVDDYEGGVTHVIRGEDHVSNTPRQILIQEAIGAPRPIYAHLPLIVAKDRSKLSKRKHGAAVSLDYYRKKGYLPQGLLNYLALLGWNPGTEQEIFTLEELIKVFSFDQVQKSSAVFDETKLAWVNREHMLRLTDEAFWEHAEEFLSSETVTELDALNLWRSVIPVMRERASTFGDIRVADEAGEYRYYYQDPIFPPESLSWKEETSLATKARLERILALLEGIPDPWTTASIKTAVWDYAEKVGRGQVLWPMRFGLTGKDKSPDPFTVAGIIGRDATIRRITSAISLLTP
jgi:glutamyl-tRNA synthetase